MADTRGEKRCPEHVSPSDNRPRKIAGEPIHVHHFDPDGISIPNCEIGDIIGIYKVMRSVTSKDAMLISSFSCSRNYDEIDLNLTPYGSYEVIGVTK